MTKLDYSLINNLLIINTLAKIKYKLNFFGNFIWYYLIPNLSSLVYNKVSFLRIPSFNISTIFRGQGEVKIGNNCVFGSKMGGFHSCGSVEFLTRAQDSKIVLGDEIWTNNKLSIICQNNINIGSKTLIGQNVIIMDFEAHQINPLRRTKIGEVGSVEIGKNVWIGSNVIILKNTNIGDNSIVAAGAVVSGIFPGNVIIGGIPAKIIKTIEES